MQITEKQWNILLSNFTSDVQLIRTEFQNLLKRYSEVWRYYHNLQHIENLLDLYYLYEKKINAKSVFLFSVFYHDVVYNIGSKTNEEDSAEMAFSFLETIKFEARRCVKDLILRTKHIYSEVVLSDDEKLFLDFDLSTLGSANEIYLKNTQNIYLEYSGLDKNLFIKGRMIFLQEMLKRPFIFHSDLFRNKYEMQAQLNLSKELNDLNLAIAK